MNRHFPHPTSAKARANLRRQAKQREAVRAALRDLRNQARAEIDRLLSFLDASDLDPDLEPELGFPETDLSHYKSRDQSLKKIEDGRCGSTDRREADDGDLEPSLCGVTAEGLTMPQYDAVFDGEAEQEDEPSLGFQNSINQTCLSGGLIGDRELDESDDEPSLGFLEADEECGHLGHVAGTDDDRELETDSGIADWEGLMEQCPHLFQTKNLRVE